MIIDIVVPARTPQIDYLHHPECGAAKVANLVGAGKSASEIASALGVSRFKVGKVIEFLDMVPNPLRLVRIPVMWAPDYGDVGRTSERSDAGCSLQ